MKKSAGSKHAGQRQSAKIMPGTGSGSRPKGGSTSTSMSNPTEKHGLGRKPAGKTLT